MYSIETLLSASESDVKNFLTTSGVSLGLDRINNYKRLLLILNSSNQLDEYSSSIVNNDNMWKYISLFPENYSIGFNRWKNSLSRELIILYVDPTAEDFVSPIYKDLRSANIKVISSSIPEKHDNVEVFLLTAVLGNAISLYGNYCTVIVCVDEETLLNRKGIAEYDLLQSQTVACSSSSYLKEYLLKDYDTVLSQLTFALSGSNGLAKDEMFLLLRGWKLLYNPTLYIDLLFHEAIPGRGKNKVFDRVPAGIKNVVDSSTTTAVTDKSKLFSTFNSLDVEQRFVLKSKDLADSDTMKSLGMGNVVIVRPVGAQAFKGAGIRVVTNDRDLNIAKNKMKKWPKATVSEYIKDPLLYKGLKFHTRNNMIVTSWGTSTMFPKSDISHAKLPYKQTDWSNVDIHDTHFASTIGFTITQDTDLPLEAMQRGIDEIQKLIAKALLGAIKAYSECSYGYDILGLDIIYRRDGSPVLLEVNDGTGFGTNYTDQTTQWYKELNDWIFSNTIQNYINTTCPLKLVLIQNASLDQIKQLSLITTDINNMKWIGNSAVQSYENLLELAERAREEKTVRYMDCLVVSSERVVGYVSIRPLNIQIKGSSEGDAQIRRIIGDKGKGYGTRAGALAVNQYRKMIGRNTKVWSVVRTDNINSINMMAKGNWKRSHNENVYGKLHIIYYT